MLALGSLGQVHFLSPLVHLGSPRGIVLLSPGGYLYYWIESIWGPYLAYVQTQDKEKIGVSQDKKND